MAFEWMNGGPGPLDLTTPMLQGEEQGAQAAYRRAQIAQEAQRSAQMEQALNLQQKQEAFQETMWNQGAGLRNAQMDLTQANAATASQQAQATATGQPILNKWMTQVDGMSDPTEINNTSIPPGLTGAQQAVATDFLNNKRATQAASIASDTASKLHLAQTTLTTNAVNAGLDPSTFQDTDGNIDYAAMGDAVNQAGLAKTQAEQNIKTQGDIAVQTAKQNAIGTRQQQYLQQQQKFQQLSPKMSGIDQANFKRWQTMYDGNVAAKGKAPANTDTSEYDAAMQQAVNGMDAITSRYNGTTAPSLGASRPSGVISPGVSSALPAPSVSPSPSTQTSTLPPAIQSTLAQARAAIAAGKDANSVRARLQQAGIDPGLL